MRESYFKMRFAYGSKLLTLVGSSSLLRQPSSADQRPAAFEGFTDIGYEPGQTNLETAYANEPADSSAPEAPSREEMIREYDLGHKMGVGGISSRRLPPE